MTEAKSLWNGQGIRQDDPLVQGDLETIPEFNATTESLSKHSSTFKRESAFPVTHQL